MLDKFVLSSMPTAASVAIVGCRMTGKTTLAKKLAENVKLLCVMHGCGDWTDLPPGAISRQGADDDLVRTCLAGPAGCVVLDDCHPKHASGSALAELAEHPAFGCIVTYQCVPLALLPGTRYVFAFRHRLQQQRLHELCAGWVGLTQFVTLLNEATAEPHGALVIDMAERTFWRYGGRRTLEERVEALERAVALRPAGDHPGALERFDPAQIAPHEATCVVGRRRTGKTQVALALAAGRDVVGVMCGTEEDAAAWERAIPKGTPLTQCFNPHLLDYCLSLEAGCVVMDALAVDRSMFETLRQATEHPKVGTLITAMYAAPGYPGGRYWLALRESVPKNRERLYRATCAEWAGRDTFEMLLAQATADDCSALVIDTEARTFRKFAPESTSWPGPPTNTSSRS